MSYQIGQYRILAELGAGGMGVVYRALDLDLQREVAVKRLRSEFAASLEVRERFRKEAQMQGRMNHQNIAQLYSLIQNEDAFCIVMEFVDGVVVKDLLPLPWRGATAVAMQTLEALEYAHRGGVLHRDIKPENIMVDQRGMVKVMDFGIAHAIGTQRTTREKSLIGTIEYMPPERILGKPMDGRSDVYSTGILLFELLSGRLPFDVTTEYDILRWQIEAHTPNVSKYADVPAVVNQIIAKATAKDPDLRYRSCDEMVAHLRDECPESFSTQQLVALVTGKVRRRTVLQTDLNEIYAEVKNFLDCADVKGAEAFLETKLAVSPGNPPLEAYSQMLKNTLKPMANDSQEAVRLRLLQVIAAEKAGDKSSTDRVLSSFRDDKAAPRILAMLSVHYE
jgi:serine/threonine protein kinase